VNDERLERGARARSAGRLDAVVLDLDGPAADGRDADADLLDDETDRQELRTRYYGLLQENRVLVPGVQILVAFLIAVPFNGRFTELDGIGRALWLSALFTSSVAVITLMAPIVFHRVGERRRRAARLGWAIRMQRSGIVCIALSMCLALTLVTRFAIGGGWAAVTVSALGGVIVVTWIVVPRAGGLEHVNSRLDPDRVRRPVEPAELQRLVDPDDPR
jgi:hypothetical protein